MFGPNREYVETIQDLWLEAGFKGDERMRLYWHESQGEEPRRLG
jgi:hypothetical protein